MARWNPGNWLADLEQPPFFEKNSLILRLLRSFSLFKLGMLRFRFYCLSDTELLPCLLPLTALLKLGVIDLHEPPRLL